MRNRPTASDEIGQKGKRKMKNYKIKSISLGGNRKLINAVKKEGLQTFNPQGKWNGYGYEKLPLSVRITSISEMRKFNKIKNEIEESHTRQITEQEKKEKWATRLSKLTGISISEALEIAKEKEEYKAEQIEKMEDKQFDNYSVKREKLINKMERENPLRYIKNKEHAQAILSASRRHNCSNYEEMLDVAREKASSGDIDKSEVKEYARQNMRF